MASFLSSELKSMLFLWVLKSRTNLFWYLMYRQWPVYFPFSEYTDVLTTLIPKSDLYNVFFYLPYYQNWPKNDHTWSVEIKRIQYHLTIHLLHVDICKKRWPITDLTGAAFYQFVAIENYPVGFVQTVSEEFLMAMDGILFVHTGWFLWWPKSPFVIGFLLISWWMSTNKGQSST